MRKVIAMVFALTVSSCSWAFEKTVSGTYVFGHGDSKMVAEEILREKLKLKAMESVGTYVESTSVLKNQSVSENVRIISAGLVGLSNIKTKYSLTKSGEIKLQMTAKAEVNESVLDEKIKELSTNKRLAQEIEGVSAERDRLIARIDELERRLKKKHISYVEMGSILKEVEQAKVSNLGGASSISSFLKSKSSNEEMVTKNFEKDYQRFWDLESQRLVTSIDDVKDLGNKVAVTVKIVIDEDFRHRLRKLLFPDYEGINVNKHFEVNFLSRYQLKVSGDEIFKEGFEQAYRQVAVAKLKHVVNSRNVNLVVSVNGAENVIEFFGTMKEDFFSNNMDEMVDAAFDWSRFEHDLRYGGNYWGRIGVVQSPNGQPWRHIKDGIIATVYVDKANIHSGDEITARFEL